MRAWIIKQWRDISGNVKFWLLGLFGVAIVSAAVSITHGLLLWQQITLAALFITLFAWAMIASFARSKAIVTLENIESHVQDWLDGFNLAVRRVPDEKAIFAFEVTTVSQIPIAVRRTRDRAAYLSFSTRFSPSPSHQTAFQNLSSYKKNLLLATIRLEAAKAKVNFIAAPDFGRIVTEKLMLITNSLSEADMLNGISEANFSTVFLQNLIALELEPKEAQPD